MATHSCAQNQAIEVDGLAPAAADAGTPEATRAPARPRALARLASIDVLRGLVIVIMALDHVRDYFTGYASIRSTSRRPRPSCSSRAGSRTSAHRFSYSWRA